MAIEYPRNTTLGAKVNAFPEVQYAKIKEIIDALNNIIDGSISTDVISEQTAAAGVTIDGLLIKDNAIVNATSVSASTNVTSGYFTDGVQAITGPGAISVTKGRTEITTTGADAFTLAAGTSDGMEKSVYFVSKVGNATITPTGLLGFTTITLTAVGQGVTMKYSASQSKWAIVGNHGATIA